jgi:hypothetical protein
MAYPGEEMQSREDAAKPQMMSLRESAVDRATRGEVSFFVDMRPTTLLEQSQMRGFERTTKPVGMGDPAPTRWETVGGRASNDVLAARQLGSLGRDD